MFSSKEISKNDPLTYNQNEDIENKKGCAKDDPYEVEEQEVPVKPRIYQKSPDPYYDPTD